MKKSIIILLLMCFASTFAVENYEEFEDSYVQINAKNLKDDFFMVKYNGNTDEVFVGMNTLFYFLELYTLEVNLEKKIVFGELDKKDIKVHFDEDESFVVEDELYVDINSLKKKLFFRNAKFDFASLKLELEPEFILAYEEREKGRVERLRLDSRKTEENRKLDFEMPRKLITPGLFKIDYTVSDIEESDYNINYEYASQLFYGEFYLSGEFKPKNEINYGNLTYSDIVGNNDLVVGNFSLIAPSFLDVDTKILGVSFDDNETYMTKDGGVTIIRGEAKNAETIELYRNSFLVDYIKPYSENFEFKIDDGVFNSDYTLKIYHKNGEIEERKVYSLSDSELLKKGKNRISVQGGQSDNEKLSQYIGKFHYGITDNLTVGIGGMDLTSDEGKKYKILQNNILFRTGTEKLPTLIDFKNYYEYDKKENSYELSVEQKIYSFDLKFVENRYSDYIISGEKRGEKIKKYNSLSIGKDFNRNFLEIGGEEIEKLNSRFDEKEKNIYGILNSSSLSPVYLSLGVYKNIEGSDDDIKIRPSVSYSTFNGISLLLEGDIAKQDNDNKYSQEYSLRINWRKQDMLRDRVSIDVGAEINYNRDIDEFTYGLSFNVELDDIIYMRIPTRTSVDGDKNRTTTTGVEISKIIDLSNPTRKIKRNISLNSSWIYGKVFLDRNGNGIYDEGERVLPDVAVTVNNRRFYSDKDGDYVAEGFYSNEEVILDVDRRTLDPMMKNSKGDLKIKTRKSSGAKIDVPVETVSMIMGNIWNTEEFTEREFIRHISLTTILLEKDGKLVKEVDPEFDGMFFIEDVTPGNYTLRFEYLGDANIGFSNKTIPINVALQNPEEGEYFEGNDTVLMLVDEEDSSDETSDEVEDMISNY